MSTFSNIFPTFYGPQGLQGVQGPIGSVQGVRGIQGAQGINVGGFSTTGVSGAYSLTTSDVGKLILINSGISTISVSQNTFSFGNTFMVYNGTSMKQKIQAGSGVTFYSGDGTQYTGDKYLFENDLTTILCSSTNEFIFSGSYSSDIVTDGLILYVDSGVSTSYSGSGTTLFDLSSTGNNGTLANGVVYENSNQGILTFDGSDDHISFTSNPSVTGQITAEVWVNLNTPPSGGNARTILSKELVYRIVYSEIDIQWVCATVNNSWYSTGTVASTPLVINSWIQIVGTYDGTNNRIYINGELKSVGQNISGNILTDNTYNFNLMDDNNIVNLTNGKGSLSSARIYNRALSADEIRRNYYADKRRFE